MSSYSDAPMYNLKAVVQETGLKPDTIRAWERRYGMPEPERAESGHRLYTGRDIEILKWLMARQAEGLSISRAVALWERMEAEEGDPLASPHVVTSMPQVSLSPLPIELPTGNPYGTAALTNGSLSANEPLVELRKRWITACLNFDEQTAEQALTQAFALFPAEMVCLQLLQQGLATIGQGWYEGRVTVHQGHFASALATRRLEALLASTPPPSRAGRILVGCPPEEAHTFVPLLLSMLLRRKGWEVLYLGANLPLENLDLTVEQTHPDLVLLTAQQLYTAASLLQMAQALAHRRIPVAYGGLVFNRLPDIRRVIPGYYLGTTLDHAVDTVANVMIAPRAQLAQEAVPHEYRIAAERFNERRATIDAQLWKSLKQSDIPRQYLAAANASLGRDILAALSLGDIDLLGPDLDWVQGLLINHHLGGKDQVQSYLAAYRDAASEHLGDDGSIIVAWLNRTVNSHGEFAW